MPDVFIVDDSPSDQLLIGMLFDRDDATWRITYADSGPDALDLMNNVMPDLLITDMRMPGMDGLELMEKVRSSYPTVPVILVTGYGTEHLALQALRRGAASYVSKEDIAQRLMDTVKQVLEVADSETSYYELIGSLNLAEYHFSLENDPRLIPPLVDLLQHMTHAIGVCDEVERRHVGVALDEALINGLYHGNLHLPARELPGVRAALREGSRVDRVEQRRQESPYCDRKLEVIARITPTSARFDVRDEGDGFDTDKLAVPQSKDLATLEARGNRGLVLMMSFMDEVTFNDAGNQVTMIKRRRSENQTP